MRTHAKKGKRKKKVNRIGFCTAHSARCDRRVYGIVIETLLERRPLAHIEAYRMLDGNNLLPGGY